VDPLDVGPDPVARERLADRVGADGAQRGRGACLRRRERPPPLVVVERRGLDVVDHHLLAEQACQCLVARGTEPRLEVPRLELTCEHRLCDEARVLLDGVARLRGDEAAHHHEDRHACDREAHPGEEREPQDEAR
jgi:hypothetical protein